MSEHGTATATRRPEGRKGNGLSRLWRSLTLFLSQVMDEMRKVVRPTRQELTTYTTVVIVFVAIIMLLVFGLDSLISRLVFLVFAGS